MPALVQSFGAEGGVRLELFERWRMTTTVWRLDLDSELVFVGGAGTTESSRPSRREGVEWSHRVTLNKFWALDGDFSISRGRFRDADPAGCHIPGAIVLSNWHGRLASLRVRNEAPGPDDGGYNDIHLHPVEPRAGRLVFTLHF